MDIVRLPTGQPAPVDADCLRIEEQEDGSFKLTATALCIGDDEGASVSIVGGPVFASAELAEQAGLAWAENVGATKLLISSGTIAQPLRLSEMDLPL